MRAAGALLLLLVMGCTTVRTGRELQSTERSAPRCGRPSRVVTAAPLDYPNVLLDVVEERSCEVEITSTFVERAEVHVSETALGITAAALGAAVGLGGYFALNRGTQPGVGTPQFLGGDRVSYQGDAAIILPIVGAVAGYAAWALIGRQHPPVQTLPVSTDVETSPEPFLVHSDAVEGTLTLRDGTVVGQLQGGQAAVPLALAQRAFREGGLLVDGQPMEWSLKAGTWTPALSAACARTLDARDEGLEGAPLGALARATRDAKACRGEGWAFANEVATHLERICARRFAASCEDARK